MKRHTAFLVFSAFCLSIVAWSARATEGVTYLVDTPLQVSGHELVIEAGSRVASLEKIGESFLAVIPAGEALIVRYPGPSPRPFENDGNLAPCNVVPVTKDNRLFIAGPRTITLTPSDAACFTGNSDKNTTPGVTIDMPAQGEVLRDGSTKQLFWTKTGVGISSVRIRLSADGGVSFPTVIVDDLLDSGFYSWKVPLITTTSTARLRIDGMDGVGNLLAIGLSPVFVIEGLEPEPEPGPEGPATAAYDYDASSETASAASIGVDKGLVSTAGNICVPETRIKSPSNPAVYYCGADGKRYVFPNQKTHDTWYDSFAGVVNLTEGELASIPIGGNATYRPGIRLVKITTDPKVYAVAAGGVLRWVPDEATAEALYGSDWNTKIDDIPDAFFTNYRLGDPIETI